MSDRGDDVRTTAEQLEADAEQLKAIEAEKMELPDEDPRVVLLSEEALRLTERMTKTAEVQLAIAKDPTT